MVLGLSSAPYLPEQRPPVHLAFEIIFLFRLTHRVAASASDIQIEFDLIWADDDFVDQASDGLFAVFLIVVERGNCFANGSSFMSVFRWFSHLGRNPETVLREVRESQGARQEVRKRLLPPVYE